MTAVLVAIVIAGLSAAVIITCEWHNNQPVPFTTTELADDVVAVTGAPRTAGQALTDAITEHLLNGGTTTDILGGDLKWHPSVGYVVELVTRETAAHVGDEVEAWLQGGAV